MGDIPERFIIYGGRVTHATDRQQSSLPGDPLWGFIRPRGLLRGFCGMAEIPEAVACRPPAESVTCKACLRKMPPSDSTTGPE